MLEALLNPVMPKVELMGKVLEKSVKLDLLKCAN